MFARELQSISPMFGVVAGSVPSNWNIYGTGFVHAV